VRAGHSASAAVDRSDRRWWRTVSVPSRHGDPFWLTLTARLPAAPFDDDEAGCRGRELRHEGDPVRCWVWTLGGYTHCDVQ